MSSVIGVFALALMVLVLLIAVASLAIVAIIPLGKYLDKRREDQSS